MSGKPGVSLSAYLVEEGVLASADIEASIARQVLYGGDLATNVLDALGLEKEAPLGVALARYFELPYAGEGALHSIGKAASRVPVDAARRNAMYPLEENEEGLVVAVAEPPPEEVLADLGFTLGFALTLKIAPLVRIRQALARDFGVPLDRRLLRLCAKLDGAPDPSPSSMPPPNLRANPVDLTPQIPRAAAIPKAAAVPRAGNVPRIDLRALVAAENKAPTAEVAPRTGPALPKRMMKWLRKASLETPVAPRKRRRGPMTSAIAEEELGHVTTPTEALEVFFDFARQYFEYAALFVIHGDLAEGRDASGPGASREHVTGVGLPLELPSCLARARDRGVPICAPLEADGLDAQLAQDLQRTLGKAALALPILLRGRAVAVLYADNGEAAVELSDAGEVVSFASRAGAVLETLARKKKERIETAASHPPALRRDTLTGLAVPAAVLDETPLMGPVVLARALGVQANAQPPITAPTPSPAQVIVPRVTASFTSPLGDIDVTASDLDVAATHASEPPVTTQPTSPALMEKLVRATEGNSEAWSHYEPPALPKPERQVASQPTVMLGEGIEPDLVGALLEPRARVAEIVDEVLKQGSKVVPPIVARLPGPLAVSRAAILSGETRPQSAGPLFRALVALKKTAIPALVEAAKGADASKRFYATFVFAELPYPEVVEALAARMFDPNDDVRAVARLAAKMLGPEKRMLRPLVDAIDAALSDPLATTARRTMAVSAMGELRIGAAVPTLISALEEGGPIVGIVPALVSITCRDYGNDAAAWRTFWNQNRSRHRVEWLVDALLEDDARLRERAAEDLRAISPRWGLSRVGIAPRAEREDLRARYLQWWRESGHAEVAGE